MNYAIIYYLGGLRNGLHSNLFEKKIDKWGSMPPW
jgi:hypothetical protein